LEKIFDSGLLVLRKRRALAAGASGANFLMERVAADLADRLVTVGRSFPKAATIFCGTPHAREVLIESGKVSEVIRLEADSAFLDDTEGLVAAPETLPFAPQSLDLAVSLLSLHEVNDIPGMLLQIRRALKADGLFLAAMAGADTLKELRESLLTAETELYGGASPRVFPFTDIRDAGMLLQRAGFALPVTDIESLTVRYDTMFHLLRDLRAMGATNALHGRLRKPASQQLFARAAQIYAERFADADGRLRATFAILWLSGWAPDASQQKPLRPGSAQVSLAKVLPSD
jgi:SAM-dependent methyltransferase